jgi:hypothetical protein
VIGSTRRGLRGVIYDNLQNNYIVRKITLIIEVVVNLRTEFMTTFQNIARDGYSDEQVIRKCFLDTFVKFKSNVKEINNLIPDMYIEAELKKKYPRNDKIVKQLLEYISYNTD